MDAVYLTKDVIAPCIAALGIAGHVIIAITLWSDQAQLRRAQSVFTRHPSTSQFRQLVILLSVYEVIALSYFLAFYGLIGGVVSVPVSYYPVIHCIGDVAVTCSIWTTVALSVQWARKDVKVGFCSSTLCYAMFLTVLPIIIRLPFSFQSLELLTTYATYSSMFWVVMNTVIPVMVMTVLVIKIWRTPINSAAMKRLNNAIAVILTILLAMLILCGLIPLVWHFDEFAARLLDREQWLDLHQYSSILILHMLGQIVLSTSKFAIYIVGDRGFRGVIFPCCPTYSDHVELEFYD